MNDEQRAGGPESMTATTRRLSMFVVGTGSLLGAMTGSTINLALPDLSANLGVTIDQSGWVISSFLLIVAAALLLAGRVADLVGHREVYLTGFALFGISSLGCGLAPGFTWLLAGRVAQGIGAAMLMAAAPALLTTSYPPTQRGKALGNLMTATYVGLVIGPPLGGWIIGAFGWRFIFHMMVPIAAVVFVIGFVFLPPTVRKKRSRFDWGGALTLVIGLPLLLLPMAEGQRWGWSSPLTLVSAALGVLLMVGFTFIELRGRTPLIDLSMFRSRIFTFAVLSASGLYLSLFMIVIMLPFYLLEGLSMTTTEAGVVLTAQPAIMALVSTPVGRLSDRLGTRWLSVAGLVICTVGMGGLTTVGPDTSPLIVATWLGIMGLGIGVFISPNSSAIMGSAPGTQQGVAGGVMVVARSIGMMIGVALATTIFTAAGGETGREWVASDHEALRTTLVVATVISAVSTLLAGLGGDLPRTEGS